MDPLHSIVICIVALWNISAALKLQTPTGEEIRNAPKLTELEEDRIFNAAFAGNEAPYQVILNVCSDDTGCKYCAGNYIHHDYIVTAGQCLDMHYYDDGTFTYAPLSNVWLYPYRNGYFNGVVLGYALEVTMHPGYVDWRNLKTSTDIALLKMAHTNGYVPSPVRLATPAEFNALDFNSCFVAYGAGSQTSSGSLIGARTRTASPVQLTDCQRLQGWEHWVDNVHTNTYNLGTSSLNPDNAWNMCVNATQTDAGRSSICQNDQGAALVHNHKLFGVGAQFYIPCEDPVPQVFTSVAEQSIYDWILATIQLTDPSFDNTATSFTSSVATSEVGDAPLFCENCAELSNANMCNHETVFVQATCSCDHGTAPTGTDCTGFNGEQCIACDDRYELAGYSDWQTCVQSLNECFCLHGTEATGSGCAVHLAHTCTECHEGHTMDGNQMCFEKQCTCTGGTAANGTDCQVHNNPECLTGTCITGFHEVEHGTGTSYEYSTCEGNTCSCSGGTEETVGCQKEGGEECVADTCDNGYHDVEHGAGSDYHYINCEVNVCTCTGGTALTGTACFHGNELCQVGSCRDGYSTQAHWAGTEFEYHTCEPNVCHCTNGSPPVAGNVMCVSNGMFLCASCLPGFSLDDGACQQVLSEQDCIDDTPLGGAVRPSKTWVRIMHRRGQCIKAVQRAIFMQNHEGDKATRLNLRSNYLNSAEIAAFNEKREEAKEQLRAHKQSITDSKETGEIGKLSEIKRIHEFKTEQ